MSSVAAFERQMKLIKLAVLAVVALGVAVVAFFAYRWFIAPAGKVVWSWTGGVALDSRLLAAPDGRLLLYHADELQRIEAASPAVTPWLKQPGLGAAELTSLDDGGMLAVSSTQVTRLGADGAARFTVALPEHTVHTELAADRSVLVFQTRSPSAVMQAWAAFSRQHGAEEEGPEIERLAEAFTVEMRKLEEQPGALDEKESLGVIDLATGKVAWNTPWPADVGVAGFAATHGVVVATMSKVLPRGRVSSDANAGDDADAAAKVRLVAFNAADGALLDWKAPLEELPAWGPVAADGKFLVMYRANRIAAINPAGERLYTLELPATDDAGEFAVLEDMICVCFEKGVVGYDLATGQGRWTLPVATEISALHLSPDAVYVMGTRTTQVDFDITSMQGFNQHQDMVRDMGLDKLGQTKNTPVLIAVDRATGAVRWETEQVVGDLAVSADRVVLVMDTSRTSTLAMFKEGHADTVVEQFNPANGRRMYSYSTSNQGFYDPHVVGNRLVGFTYDPGVDGGQAVSGDDHSDPDQATLPGRRLVMVRLR